MTISFNPLKANGHLFTHLPELDDLEFSLSNANAADVLDALGIEDAYSASPWPLSCLKVLLVVARRKRIGHASPAIPVTETQEPGSMVLIDCGRAEGFLPPTRTASLASPSFLNLIKAPRTVLVLNEWRMSADNGASAFAGVIADTRVAAARADGARIVTMRHRHRSLSERSDQPMSPAHQHMAKSWLNRMKGNFAPVTPWFD
jgi:hypothetical protein